MGGQRPRDPRPGQLATDTTKPPPRKKTKRKGGGKPHQRQQPHTPAPQAVPQEGRGQAGHTPDRTHTPTTQPRGAGHSQNPSPAHTPTQHTPARKGGVQAGHAHERTHAPTPQPGVAGPGSSPGPTTHPRTAPPTRTCRRPRGTGTQAHTHSNTFPRRGGAQPKPGPQHARPHRTPEPGTAGCRRSAHRATYVPKP